MRLSPRPPHRNLSLISFFSSAGRSLEGMDKLFEVPLHRMYKNAYPTDEDLKPEMRASGGGESIEEKGDKGTTRHVELV